MIELEIQVLSEKREGLLIDIGRCATSNGFTLQRQRVTQDVNGALLSMVVRGSMRKQRALESALETHERVISYELSEFVEGEVKPHFGAARTFARPPVAAAPVPVSPPVPASAPAAVVKVAVATAVAFPDFASTAPVRTGAVEVPAAAAVVVEVAAAQTLAATVGQVGAKEPDFEFILPEPSRRVAAAPVPEAAFVDLVPLDPDIDAVDKALRSLELDFPQIVPRLLTLDRAVAPGARESSLSLAGQRTGAWVFERSYAAAASGTLHEAIESIGVPALRELVEVEQKGDQLHIHNSPLCAEHDHSGCGFFSGYLEGVLGPAVGSDHLSIFPVCCRSFGADACVLAISG
ncbi:MAG: hypothetical protein WC617_16065 [Rhodanobacter sp.]|jgi:hypothetical protein